MSFEYPNEELIENITFKRLPQPQRLICVKIQNGSKKCEFVLREENIANLHTAFGNYLQEWEKDDRGAQQVQYFCVRRQNES